MKRFIAIAAALAAIVICSEGTAQAQIQLNQGGFPYPSYIQQGLLGGPGALVAVSVEVASSHLTLPNFHQCIIATL